MNDKIKILQFPIANSYGGITHYALNNWYHMNKTEFMCDFATMSKKLDFEDEITKTGSKVFYISCYAEDNKEQFRKEFLRILDNEYDVVHLHTKQWKSFFVEELCKEKGVRKVIIHSHSTRCDSNNDEIRAKETSQHYKIREQIDSSVATDFWACSESAAEWLFGNRIGHERIKIMKNAIDTEKFIYNDSVREFMRQELEIGPDDFVIGNVGRLSYPKNQKFLIQVFFNVVSHIDNAMLIFVGEGDLKSDLLSLSKTFGLENRIRFMGKRNDVYNLYQIMDVFALPSNFEGFPISVMEALASGLDCLVSNTVTDEILIDNRVRLLPLDVDIWTKAIIDIFKKGMKDRMNMKNIIIDSGFDMDHQIRVIEEDYRKSIV